MSQILIFRNFKAPKLNISKFSRKGELQAWDADLHDGSIRPFKCPEELCKHSAYLGAHFLYPQAGCECLAFADNLPVQGFCRDQHFQVSSGVLNQFTLDANCQPQAVRAGAPTPTQRPSASGSCTNCSGVAVSYLSTFVTQYAGIQVESGPSQPSVPVAGKGNVPNAVVTFGDTPDMSYPIISRRIYRVESSFHDGQGSVQTVGAEWVWVGDIAPTENQFIDNFSTADTGYPLMTNNPMLNAAPTGLKFICRTDDGIAVADESRVYISIAGQPMFNVDGVVNVEGTIREIRAIDNAILVWTNKYPVVIRFQISEGLMGIDRQVITRHLPLTSRQSVSIYNGTAYFASEMSLYAWNPSGGIRSVLSDLLTPAQWKMLDPDTVAGVAHEYGYLLSSAKMEHSLFIELAEDGTDTRAGLSIMPISYVNARAMALTDDGIILYRQDDTIMRWDYRRVVDCEPAINDIGKGDMCNDECPYTMVLYTDNESKNTWRVMRVEWDERSAPSVAVSVVDSYFGAITIKENIECISSRPFSVKGFSSNQTQAIVIKGTATVTELRVATAFADLSSRNNADIANGVE